MATLTISVTNQGGVNSVSLIYEVSSTNDTTTVTVTTLVCRSAVTRTYFPVSVKCDGTTLYSNTVEFTSSGIAYAINKTKSFARNTSAASKSLTLTALGTSKSATITVPALPSYTVTYNGNGSTGGSTASQTKYYGKSLTLRSNGFTRTNYVFKNWNTNSAGTGTAYASGANYTANAALALYAQWYAPYTVAYNANGGTGAPASQVKVYNTALTLRTEKPTRPDFVFTSWNTSSAGSGTSYASGASYTANANATLYAQWRRIYSNPNVSIMSVQRVDATTHEADDVGTSVAVEISWSLFDTPSGTNHPTSIVVACNGVTETLADLTGLTGTATAYLDAGCYPDQQYPVTATLTDEGGASRSVTAEGVVTTPYYPIDIRQGGRGVAIGGPSAEDALDIFMPTKILPRSTSANETPLAISDGTDDVLTVDWDGVVDCGGIAPKWATASSFFTSLNSGWSNDTSYTQLAYSPTLRRVVGRIKLQSTAAHSAGNNAIGTVGAAYRPYIRALCTTTTNGAYRLFIDADGTATMVLGTSTTTATTDFYLAVDYTVA